ncbi:putative polyketide synthase [Massarina eburnea CBS 473.64]|uniref:Putative polyketide synthase n=1 Tax=Massarina eburnea CBS 473.64 TaxID=1395130 RepID=A0A6A6S0K1_9PLEO|nr:putative polyketide synthase [Massarina eburnea CBS 473.64]
MGSAKLTDSHSVAVTGLSCRFPGDGDSLDTFWESICAGKSAWSKIPKERFNVDAFWSPSKNRNTMTTQGAHFLKQDISKFDANFFSLPKNDVEATDPQHRIMIEVAYEALERAGLPLEKIAGTRTGVFMGHFTSDYKEMMYRDPDNAPVYGGTGSCTTSLSARMSWLWDLQGPCFTLDTACSSSLVALHLACQSLRTGESDIAIVGGTSLLLNPEMFMYLSNQSFLSPDGKCKSFDESANGYGRGEGFGCVILKRVDDAISAGDPIRAVIRGTGSNQDGHTKGLTLPNANAQASLIEDVYRSAGLGYEDTGYIEAHGTGTQAGDREESQALARTIASAHTSDNKLLVGSVKSNIGHLEAAAGIAGVIKAVLILETGLIPPSINFTKLNPKLNFDEWKLQVATELTPWPTSGVRRISTNSFGYGGTNAHSVIDDAASYLSSRGISATHHTQITHPEHASSVVGLNDGSSHGRASKDRSGPRLFVLSAQDKDGLKRVKDPLAKYVEMKGTELETESEQAEEFLAELAYTLSERRSRLQWKSYAIASSSDELSEVLGNDESPALVAQSSRQPRLGFVFTGQGAQWARMGMELMAYRVFRESVYAADAYLKEACECPWSAVEELEKGKSTSQLHLAEFSQALCTVLQVALVELLRAWNIQPNAVAGHSSGEIAAAYALGALTNEDAWKIAYYRGVLSTEMKANSPDVDGSMMAAGLSPEKAEEWISKVTAGELVVACINSPTSVTISGDTPGIEQLLALLQDEKIFARKLQVDTAYHSPHMQAVAQDYYELLADIVPQEPRADCTMHSSVIGSIIESKQLGAVNWVRNLVSPVKFSTAIYDMLRPVRADERATDNAVDLLIEIGPHAALQGPSTQSLKAHNIMNIPYQSVIVRNQNAVETALNLAGSLFAQGYRVNIQEVNADGDKHFAKPLVDVPTYPWKHSQRYYHDVRIEKEYLNRKTPKLSLIGAPVPAVGEREHLWRGHIRLSEESWIGDHKIQGAILYPAAGYLAMALEASFQTADVSKRISAYKLRDIQLTSAAIISDEADLECIVQLRPHIVATRDGSSTWTEFTVTTSPDGSSLVKNCSGLVYIEYESASDSEASKEKELEQQAQKDQYSRVKASCNNKINCAEFYSDLTTMGLEYGPAFSNVREARNGNGQSYGIVEIPDVAGRIPEGCDRPHIIHPGTLDAVFHLAFAAVMDENALTAMVPKSIDEVTISAHVPWTPGVKLPGFAKSEKHGFRELKADIVMFDGQEGLPTIDIQGFLCAEISGGSSGAAQNGPKPIASKLVWRPAVNLLSSEELREALSSHQGADRLVEYLKLAYHSNPALSILEVASQSSLLTRSDLSSLSKTAEITLACVDAEVTSKLEEASHDVAVESLNFAENLSADSLNGRNYDLIVVTDLDSFGAQAERAISNLTKVLKASGRLCILASDNVLAQIQPTFDAKVLQTTLFEDSKRSLALVKKSAPTNGTNGVNGHSESESVVLIQPFEPSEKNTSISREISKTLEGHGIETEIFVWGSDVAALAGKTCISLLELDSPFLEDLPEKCFQPVKTVILESASVFWITGFNAPSASMIDGLARVVRNETPGLRIRTLHADESSLASPRRFAEHFDRAFSSKSEDDEYLIKGDLLQISRIEEDTTFNDQINGLLPNAAKTITNMPLKEIPHAVKMVIQTPGMLDSVAMEIDDLAGTELEPNFIEVKVVASSINFRDVMVAMGQIPDSKLGFDNAGYVTRVGSAVTKFKVGDRACMYGHGAHRSIHRSREDYCALIPENMSFEEAATVPGIHGTAWNALVRLARVEKGQSILIHAAAGGVGQSAIQVAKHYEMEIFATVSSEVKRSLLRDEYGVPDDHIFNSRDLSFVKGIKRMTNGRGVDVVLNSLSGEALRQTWHCIAPFGYFVEIGLRDILANTGLDMRPFMQDATFSFFNLNHIEKSRPDVMAAIIEGSFDFFRRGISKPVKPLVSYPISDIEGAFRLMQAGKHVGKLVFTWGDDDIVPVIQQQKSSLKLDPTASYVLVGGLGGLGRSLSTKLVSLGARKLAFFSRSGTKSTAAKELVHDLEQQGVQVQAHVCDVADEQSVAASVAKTTQELGNIRGVFQCAMVLRDTLFTNMTHEQWLEATRPKVQGSFNLHKHLPSVDFFISLSSFAAVFGNRGQANYAAAGAYEDALAYHRRAEGKHATTLDLGIMRDIGVLAETGITDSLRDWEKPYGIRENEFHALMERAIDGDINGTSPAQIITGLATGGSALAAGIDTPFYLDNSRFSILSLTGTRDQSNSSGSSAPVHTLIAAATTLEEAQTAITDALVKQVAKMLQMPVAEIDTGRFLHSYGIDSLVAIEVVNWALKECKSGVTVFDVLAGVPITTLTGKMAAKSAVLKKELVPI